VPWAPVDTIVIAQWFVETSGSCWNAQW